MTRLILRERSLVLGALLACGLSVHSAPALAADVQLVVNGDFSAGQAPWWNSGSTASTAGGVMQLDVAGGANPWDAILGQSGMAITAGATYTLRFDAWASAPAAITALVQLDGPPFTAYFATNVALLTTPQTFTYTFTAGVDDPAAVLQFQLGGNGAYVASFDNVSLTRPSVSAPPARIGELLRNGTFAGGETAPWWAGGASLAVASSRLEATVASGGANPWDVIVGQSGIPVFSGGRYTLTLKAWASTNVNATLILQKDGAPYTQYFNRTLFLTSTPRTFTFTFTGTAEDPAAALQLQMGGQGAFVFYLDNVSLNGPQPPSGMPTGELTTNGGFAGGLAPWWTHSVTADVSSGALQGTILNPGSNPWDAIVGQNGIPILAGGRYTYSFRAWASQDVSVNTLIQKDGPPFTGYFFQTIALTTTPQTFTFTFTPTVDDPAATLQFQIGGRGAFVFFVDDVSLQGPRPAPPTQFLSAVRVNQTGYLPRARKQATIAIDVATPVAWTLYDSGDAAVASGTTTVFGPDAPSGENLQIADFSGFRTPGLGYTLEAYGERSAPFDIDDDVYDRLKYDALAYYYHNRSGIEIAMPFAGGDEWTRAAGHVGVAPNQGDLDVPCFDGVDLRGRDWTGCSYTLDAAKGWYDAGDHGKYVVNGGISVWTLMNLYERTRHEGRRRRGAFDDGSMNIPENDNGVPDLLDEARWELEFMLAMQVPAGGTVDGEPMAGMVHHKLHDAQWTGMGLSPADDPQPRFVYPPTTAATLNLAAVGAQCARVFHHFDRAFARRCLSAAESAWKAARAHPAVYASEFDGGGGYGDGDVSDEFYWAAAELFVTTGRRTYLDFITRSPHFLTVPGTVEPNGVVYGSSLGWPTTQALGTISLAVVPSELSSRHVRAAERNIVRIADGYAAAHALEPYGVPYVSAGGYYWGSNSAVLNNMLLMGLAHDVTGHPKYLTAISAGMDYILGRNPNVRSFVSGYGERSMENPHHRFWSHQANAAFPGPPPGALAGGPNFRLEDPYVASALVGCAPQKCYADHFASYSTNEVAVNWNAPLAWTAAFLDGTKALCNRHDGHR